MSKQTEFAKLERTFNSEVEKSNVEAAASALGKSIEHVRDRKRVTMKVGGNKIKVHARFKE